MVSSTHRVLRFQFSLISLIYFLNSPLYYTLPLLFSFFFFNDTATTEIYTLSLHDALPIWSRRPLHLLPPSFPPGRRPAEHLLPRGGRIVVPALRVSAPRPGAGREDGGSEIGRAHV